MRQRLRTRRSPLRLVDRLLVLLFALALIWYGLMLLLGGLGVAPRTLNLLSGYRSAYDFLAGLGPGDLNTTVRVIAGAAGLLAFLVFAYLAYKELPRPYFARHRLSLSEDERGRVSIEPRALERIAEHAVADHPAVSGARARWGDEEVTLEVDVRRTGDLVETLRDLQGRAREAIVEHGLPERPVAVTLTGYERSQQRELA